MHFKAFSFDVSDSGSAGPVSLLCIYYVWAPLDLFLFASLQFFQLSLRLIRHLSRSVLLLKLAAPIKGWRLLCEKLFERFHDTYQRLCESSSISFSVYRRRTMLPSFAGTHTMTSVTMPHIGLVILCAVSAQMSDLLLDTFWMHRLNFGFIHDAHKSLNMCAPCEDIEHLVVSFSFTLFTIFYLFSYLLPRGDTNPFMFPAL